MRSSVVSAFGHTRESPAETGAGFETLCLPRCFSTQPLISQTNVAQRCFWPILRVPPVKPQRPISNATVASRVNGEGTVLSLDFDHREGDTLIDQALRPKVTVFSLGGTIASTNSNSS